MTDTTSQEGTSGGKTCATCQAPFDPSDDKRFAQCSTCRGNALIPQSPEDAPAPDGYEPIHLNIKKCAPPPIEDRAYYWCGATLDCPMDIQLGGVEFQKTEGRLKKLPDGTSELQTDVHLGKIHRLTDAMVALILEHAANKVVRNFRQEEVPLLTGGEPQMRYLGELRGITGSKKRRYVPQPGDKPLGQFVYMAKVRHDTDRPTENPATMVPRDW